MKMYKINIFFILVKKKIEVYLSKGNNLLLIIYGVFGLGKIFIMVKIVMMIVFEIFNVVVIMRYI